MWMNTKEKRRKMMMEANDLICSPVNLTLLPYMQEQNAEDLPNRMRISLRRVT